MIGGFDHEPPARRLALRVLTWTWCLPTTLVGLVAGLFTVHLLSGRAEGYRGATVVRSPRLRDLGGVCLGPVILCADTATPELVAHEWGHFRQHLRLGPLYLLVIGVPSVTHAAWHRARGGTFPEYFHFWTEAWADALGGVYHRHAHLHSRWTGYALGPALTVGLGVLMARAFGHALGFPFTDADALVDVAWARFPLSEQLLVPLTGGLGGDNANFWRPAAMLQFWGLRAVFGEDPTGWHAWSLLLHLSASVAAGLLLEALSLDRRVAALGAVLFAVHPLAEEVVPATARNLDLLLGLGFFGALLALLHALRPGSGRVARALFFAFGLLALGSKEAGVLLLPVGALWIALLGAGDMRARVVMGLRLLGPFAVVVVAFLAVRARVLDGVGGYRDAATLGDAGLFAHALSRGFLEPLLPSLSPSLAPLVGAPGTVATIAIWAILLLGLRRHAKLLAALAALYVPWILLFGITGTYSRRVLYVPSLAMAAVLALAGVALVSTRPTARRGSFIVVTLALFGAWLHGSPALRRYVDWDAVGRATQPFTVPDVWAAFPDGATVWLVDRPVRVDLDPRRFRLWSSRKSLNNAATTYSIEAWVDEHVPRGLKLRPLSSLVLEGEPERYPAVVSVDDGALVIRRPPALRTLNDGARFDVEEQAGGLTIRALASQQTSWLLVWDPRAPVAAAVGGRDGAPVARVLEPGEPADARP